MSTPLLPGGTGITYIHTYDTTAPDGLAGGSAHMHLACTEAYYITRGAGKVQALNPAGYSETELTPGKLVWFSPGTIHRLVNVDRRLEILVVMQNAGLPEAGDFVLVFPREILRDPGEYRRNAVLSSSGSVAAGSIESANRRRDLSIEGFSELKRAFESEGAGPLEEFYTVALELVREKLDDWRKTWQSGPVAAVDDTRAVLESLAGGSIETLLRGRIAELDCAGDKTLGMCGRLDTYRPEGVVIG